MPPFSKKLLLSFFTLLLIFSTVIPAGAQDSNPSGWAIRVSMISGLETPDAMDLKVYFSVYDPKTDLPILNVGANGAQLNLPQTNFLQNVDLKKPDVPIYIVMVLDASGSMSGAADKLRQAAKLALNNTPDNSFFSVVQFNEEIKLLQDFTQNIPAVSFAIDQYKVANKGTCLYDATYSAVESLQKAPPGRRAIILFTDGKDENASGQPCSKHTYLETSDFAQKAQIPVNTIGLSYKESGLNEVELKGIAASTGGFSAIAKTDDMGKAFENIMNGLKAQWMVEAPVYPKKGSNQVILNLTFKDADMLSTTFNVESNTDYPGPPSPVSGRMAGLQFKPENQSYDIQVAMTSPELVDYVKVEVWDTKGGSKVSEYQFKSPQQNNTFNIPADQLVVGREYQLRITAVSKTDQTRYTWAAGEDGKKIQELIHTFTFDPTANLPALQIKSVAQQNNDLLLTIKATNTQLIGGFDGWLVDENTNTQVPNSNFTAPADSAAAGTLLMQIGKNKIPEGKYTAVVRVLGKNQQVYSTVEYQNIFYQPKYPNLLQILGAALIASPIILGVIVVIILAVVGFLMFLSNREKSITGTPVLQGRLGGNLRASKGGGGPAIPVADQEPIPFRGQQGSPPPAPPQPAARQQPPPAPAQQRQPASPAYPPAGPEATLIGSSPVTAGRGETLISTPQAAPRGIITIVNAGGSQVPQGQISVTQFPFMIGRVEGSLIIPEGNISRRHAQINYNETTRVYTITDLNSSNGTRLNNQPITPGQPFQLTGGSIIGLGPNVILRFDIG